MDKTKNDKKYCKDCELFEKSFFNNYGICQKTKKLVDALKPICKNK